MSYSIEKHKHRLAAWAASRAASTSKLCRFKVVDGVKILEESGFSHSFLVNDLPAPPIVDKTHKIWRINIINAANSRDLNFTHGVAAKLINIYLKVRFVCGGNHEDERVNALHPPIDAVLLKELAKKDIGSSASEWRKFRNAGWSKYDSDTYEDVIKLIRNSLPINSPIWKVEKYWKGYQ